MNKEKHSLLYSITIRGSLLIEISPYLKRDFWYKRSKFWKWHCLRKNGSRIKTPSSKSLWLILASFCWKKNVLLIIKNALTNLILVPDFVETIDHHRCCVLYGPPCINFLISKVLQFLCISWFFFLKSVLTLIPIQPFIYLFLFIYLLLLLLFYFIIIIIFFFFFFLGGLFLAYSSPWTKFYTLDLI